METAIWVKSDLYRYFSIPDEPDLGKKISTNTLRATSSTSVLGITGEENLPATHAIITVDQATSYSMTGSDFHLTTAFTDDIVVLNATEEGLSEHNKPKTETTGDREKSSHATGLVEEGEGMGELTQSVEVIGEEEGGLVLGQDLTGEGTMQFTGHRKTADVRSLSVQEPRLVVKLFHLLYYIASVNKFQ